MIGVMFGVLAGLHAPSPSDPVVSSMFMPGSTSTAQIVEVFSDALERDLPASLHLQSGNVAEYQAVNGLAAHVNIDSSLSGVKVDVSDLMRTPAAAPSALLSGSAAEEDSDLWHLANGGSVVFSVDVRPAQAYNPDTQLAFGSSSEKHGRDQVWQAAMPIEAAQEFKAIEIDVLKTVIDASGEAVSEPVVIKDLSGSHIDLAIPLALLADDGFEPVALYAMHDGVMQSINRSANGAHARFDINNDTLLMSVDQFSVFYIGIARSSAGLADRMSISEVDVPTAMMAPEPGHSFSGDAAWALVPITGIVALCLVFAAFAIRQLRRYA